MQFSSQPFGFTCDLFGVQVSFDPLGAFGGYGIQSDTMVYLVIVIGLWQMLRKAGMPGWGALIPIYNVYLMFRLAGIHPVWMLVLLLPIANLVVLMWLAFRLAEAFGHGFIVGFFGLFVLSPIGFLILGFGRSQYEPPWLVVEPDEPAPNFG